MKKFKTILFSVFIGAFFLSLPVFAVVDDFEVSPASGLFAETNLAPGDQVKKTLKLTNNTSYVQEVKFWLENYKDGIVLIPFLSKPSLGDKIYIEIKDGVSTLFPKDTISNFKNQKIQLNLAANSSKVLTFNAYFDETTNNDYQGSSLSFDLQFEARWNGPEGEETEEETVTGTTRGTTTGGVGRGAGVVAGAGASGVSFLGESSPTGENIGEEEMVFPEETSTPKVGGAAIEKKSFFDRLLANIGDALPPFCLDKTSIIWLLIGLAIGYAGETILNKKIRNKGSGVVAGFMSFFWSECSFWWLIIGIIIGYIIALICFAEKNDKKN